MKLFIHIVGIILIFQVSLLLKNITKTIFDIKTHFKTIECKPNIVIFGSTNTINGNINGGANLFTGEFQDGKCGNSYQKNNNLLWSLLGIVAPPNPCSTSISQPSWQSTTPPLSTYSEYTTITSPLLISNTTTIYVTEITNTPSSLSIRERMDQELLKRVAEAQQG